MSDKESKSFTQEELDTAVKEALDNNNKEDTKSTLDKLQDKVAEDSKRKASEVELKEALKFNMGVEQLIQENIKYLPENTQSLVTMVEDIDDECDKAKLLKINLAKAYFSIPENFNTVTPERHAYIKNKIIDRHESQVDSDRAYDLLVTGLYSSRMFAKNKALLDHRASGSGSEDPHPNLSAWMNKAYTKGARK